MKLWLLEQDVNDQYDTYDAAVVAAESEADARATHPGGPWPDQEYGVWFSWVRKDQMHLIRVRLIGEAAPDVERGVVLASFNAG